MEEQRLYPLVVWSPTAPLFPVAPDQVPALSLSLSCPSDSLTTTPAAHALDLAPPVASPTALPCSACPYDRAAWIELRLQAGYYRRQFERCKEREQLLRQQVAELREKNWQHLYEQAQQRERVLQEQVVTLTAKVSVLEQRLRGQKSEKKKIPPETLTGSSTKTRKRGQQPTNPAPPRRNFDYLPTTEEICELPAAAACCQHCGAAFAPFPGTDNGDLIEIDVKAHRRRYQRRRYARTCTCAATPALSTAPPPPKLVPKGYLGISVWVLLLLEKYAAYQPTYRFLGLLRSFGVDLPMGTVTDGLKKLVPLFEPLYQALIEHQRQEHHWHCDETRWLVFIDWVGKANHNWNLFVIRSAHAVVFVLDPTRAHHVPEKHLKGATGIASVDRASVYKAMAQVKGGQIILAFCWAHVRRDFLEVLTGYGALNDWVVSWLEEIRELYRLNDARCEVLALPGASPATKAALPNTTIDIHGHIAVELVSPATKAALPNAAPSPTEPGTVAGMPLPDTADHALVPSAHSSAPSSQANANPGADVSGSDSPLTITAQEQQLRDHVAHLAQRRDVELNQSDLHPACAKVLTSMQNHWSGLTVFLDHPEVPLDNNAAERAERGPVVARKNYYGSGALWSGRLAAMMFSLLQTLELWDLCPLRWLTAYLTACAEAGAKPPEQAAMFLPWNLTAEQKQQWVLPSSQPQRPTAANTS
jgi:transposase